LEVVAQRILEQGLRGGGWFLLPDESAFFISDGWGAPSYASMKLRQIHQVTLEEIRHARTRDSVRTVVKLGGTEVLVACTFKRVLVFDAVSLTELRQISKVGEANDAVGIDPERDHVVVGSGFNGLLKSIDPAMWAVAGRKRVGPASVAATGFQPHQVILFHGTSGRLAWYDCLSGKVVREKRVPPFRPIAIKGSIAFLGTGTPEPVGRVIHVPSGEEEPAPVNMVRACTGIASFDLVEGELRSHASVPPFQSLQLSGTTNTLFLLAKGRISARNPESGGPVFDWPLPESFIPMAVLDEGRRAIVVDDRSNMERILLLSLG